MLNRIKKLESALSTGGRVVALKVFYSKEGDKYIETATNGKEWIKREIDPHKKLFEENYEGEVIEMKGLNDNDTVIEIGGSSTHKTSEAIYQETFNGETRALLKDCIYFDRGFE